MLFSTCVLVGTGMCYINNIINLPNFNTDFKSKKKKLEIKKRNSKLKVK